MAAEAVKKIKEAEEKGSELIKVATENAKSIIQKAETDGAEKQKSIIGEANKMKASIIEEARKKAIADCADLVKRGNKEKGGILNPDTSKFNSAVNLVAERIVNLSGDR